jgi:hypothetical protein
MVSGGNRDQLWEMSKASNRIPPSGETPSGGAVDIYGHHEFHIRLRWFELTTARL